MNFDALRIFFLEQYPDADEETRTILMQRYEFALRYCKEKRWDANDLTFEQVMEIRKQQKWEYPTPR